MRAELENDGERAMLRGPVERGPRRLVAGFGVIAAFVMLEVIARIEGPTICEGVPGILLDARSDNGGHSSSSWTFTPGLTATLRSCGETKPGTSWQAPAKINRRGLADLMIPYAKPAGEVRIVLLGGELVDGLAVPQAERLAVRLAKMADRRRGAWVTTINAAIPGYATGQQLDWLKAEGARYSPDLVVLLLDPAHDLAANLDPPTARRLSPGSPELGPLLRTSGLARWLAGRPAARPSVPIEPDSPRVLTLQDQDAALARTVKLVGELEQVTRAAGARLAVLVTAGCAPGPPGQTVCDALAPIAPCAPLDSLLAWIEKLGGRPPEVCAAGGRRWGRDAHFLASRKIWDLLAQAGLWPAHVKRRLYGL